MAAMLRIRSPLLAIVLALAFCSLVLALGARSSVAQDADSDADGYADDLELQLGSNPNDPDSTPEHFALLWTCTDGNDNDKDGKRDFVDPGCRNTVTGSTPAPTSTPAPNAPADPDSAPNGGGSGSGAPSGGTSGSGGSNTVLESGAGSVGGAADGGSGAGDASQNGSGANSGTATGAGDAKSTDSGDTQGNSADAAKNDAGDGSIGLSWILLFLIPLGLLVAAAICLLAVRRAKARRSSRVT